MNSSLITAVNLTILKGWNLARIWGLCCCSCWYDSHRVSHYDNWSLYLLVDWFAGRLPANWTCWLADCFYWFRFWPFVLKPICIYTNTNNMYNNTHPWHTTQFRILMLQFVTSFIKTSGLSLSLLKNTTYSTYGR